MTVSPQTLGRLVYWPMMLGCCGQLGSRAEVLRLFVLRYNLAGIQQERLEAAIMAGPYAKCIQTLEPEQWRRKE